jgi:cardiolipin synthase
MQDIISVQDNDAKQNQIKLIRGGSMYFALLEKLIRSANTSIHVQTYIFNDDTTGLQIGMALMDAAKRGVQVYVLADGYASQVLSQNFINRLRASGIHFRFFQPIFKRKSFYFGRRLHHKIVVIDARFSLVGGVNITNRYNDLPASPAWLDYALYAEGPVAKELCTLCWKTWNNFPEKLVDTPCNDVFFVPGAEKGVEVLMRRNDWVRKKNEISSSYIHMLRNAKSHVTIICSYFLPGKVIRRLLYYASKRGVAIKVITAGNSDVKIAKYAERWLYDWLLRNKIEIYEYQPTVLHAKCATCDNNWSTIGSYNINNLSTYASIELNLEIRDAGFSQMLTEEIHAIMKKDCIQITNETNKKTKNLIIQFSRWCAYQFIRVVLYMMTFYFKQKRGNKKY